MFKDYINIYKEYLVGIVVFKKNKIGYNITFYQKKKLITSILNTRNNLTGSDNFFGELVEAVFCGLVFRYFNTYTYN